MDRGPQIVLIRFCGNGPTNNQSGVTQQRQGSPSIGDLVFGTRAISGDANKGGNQNNYSTLE